MQIYCMCSLDLPRQMGFPLDISLYRALWWVGSTVSKLIKNPHGYNPPPNPSKNSKTLKHPHPETDYGNDSDQTLFPKFIELKSTENTLITILSPPIIEKTPSSMIKTRSVKKTNSTAQHSTWTEVFL